MSRKSWKRITVSTVMGGVATLALAAPANAVRVAPPGGGSDGSAPAPTTIQSPATAPHNQSTGTTWQALPVATGALGGIALAGAGAVTVAGVRRRRGHMANPA